MNEIEFNDTSNLKFHHIKNGVIAKYCKNKFILGLTLIGNYGESFSEEEYNNLSKTIINFESDIREFPKHDFKTQILKDTENIQNYNGPFSKYLKPEIFNRFLAKGNWQLGNINLYRNTENQKIRDDYEGFSVLHFNINDYPVSQVCTGGYNYLMFCGTKSSGSQKHIEQFGEMELIFPDINKFAEKVANHINAESYIIQEVQYNSLKSYQISERIENKEVEINGRILSPAYFDILKKYHIFPSLFVKPTGFQTEEEVRIVFKMKKDYNKPFKFKNKELLKFIHLG
jgi:hypothetical protein